MWVLKAVLCSVMKRMLTQRFRYQTWEALIFRKVITFITLSRERDREREGGGGGEIDRERQGKGKRERYTGKYRDQKRSKEKDHLLETWLELQHLALRRGEVYSFIDALPVQGHVVLLYVLSIDALDIGSV